VSNTNGRWLARELRRLGFQVQVAAALPDDVACIADFVAWAGRNHEIVVVTGGLGATPDDVTREAIARAFDVSCEVDPALEAELVQSGGHMETFAAAWACLPARSRLLGRSPGGAPAFAIANVYVLAGQPAEMRTTFKSIKRELDFGAPDVVWRKTYRVTEDAISAALQRLVATHESVGVGSYARYTATGPIVELVLRATDDMELAAVVAEVERELVRLGVTATDSALSP
jgi:molybdenum cofactor synthesis domain-containing protein